MMLHFSNIQMQSGIFDSIQLIHARDQTRLPCESGTNPFSGSGDIWGTNKKVTDSAKNRTLLGCGNYI